MNDDAPIRKTCHPLGRLALVLSFTALAAIGVRTVTQSATWLHLAIGRHITEHGIPRTDTWSFSAADAPWVASTWLYDLLLFMLWKGGPGLAIVLHVVAACGAFLLLLPVARQRADDTSVALGLLLSASLLAPVFEVRPAIFTLLFPALFIFILYRRRVPWLFWGGLAGGQLLWSNMHSSFLLGPLLCLAFAVETVRTSAGDDPQANGPRYPLKTLLIAAAVCAAVSLLNPYGPALHAHVFGLLGDKSLLHAAEWISPFSGQFGSHLAKHLTTLTLVVGAVGLVTYPKRLRLPTALTLIAIAAAAIAVITGIQIQFLALLGFPFFAVSFMSAQSFVVGFLGTDTSASSSKFSAVLAGVSLVIALFLIGALFANGYYRHVGSAASFGLAAETSLFPEEAAILIERDDFPRRTLNLMHDGAYLAWRYPERKVFLDSRPGVYDVNIIQETLQGLTGTPEDLEALLDRWEPGAVILGATSHGSGTALINLLRTGSWALAYFDGATCILIDKSQPFTEVWKNGEAQQHGLDVLEAERAQYQTRIQGVFGAPVNARLLGAASIFFQLQRFKEAHAALDLVSLNAPSWKSAWFSLGVCQMQAGEPQAAVYSLEKAARFASQNVAAWLWLSRVYKEVGREGDAFTAYQRASALNPEEAALFGNPMELGPSGI